MIKKNFKKKPSSENNIKKIKVLYCIILTILLLTYAIELGIHFIWAFKLVYKSHYKNLLINLFYAFSTVYINGYFGYKLLFFLNKKLLDDKTDQDKFKYI